MSALLTFDARNRSSIPDTQAMTKHEPKLNTYEHSSIEPDVEEGSCSVRHEIHAANNILIEEFCRQELN
jgi:hypothetical protein